VGHYAESQASQFNSLPRPATVLVKDGEAELIKRAETVEDVFATQILPERFVKAKAEIEKKMGKPAAKKAPAKKAAAKKPAEKKPAAKKPAAKKPAARRTTRRAAAKS
jgi:diaminopimelate decarboxylase